MIQRIAAIAHTIGVLLGVLLLIGCAPHNTPELSLSAVPAVGQAQQPQPSPIAEPPKQTHHHISRLLTTITAISHEIRWALLQETAQQDIPPVSTRHTTALLPAFAADMEHASAWNHYTMTVMLDPAQKSVRTRQELHFTNRTGQSLETLAFHLYPNHPDFGGHMHVSDIRIDNIPTTFTLAHDDVVMEVALPQPLPHGDSLFVTMESETRVVRPSYGGFHFDSEVWTLASWSPMLSRFLDDGWDTRPVSSQGDFSVTDVALADVIVEVPNEWHIISTGVPYHVEEVAHMGVRYEHLVSGPQREFFLAAVRDMQQSSTMVDGVQIVSTYRPANALAGEQAMNTAGEALRVFNTQFGPYPFSKLDIVQVDMMGFLGMEYPGVILIDTALYWPGNRRLDTTVAHEVAHQWWYNLVGNDAQAQGWLDEGLTSYSQVLYYEGRGASLEAEQELQAFRSQYRFARETGRDGIIDRPAHEFTSENYFYLTYAKSALFFHAMRTQIGDDAFHTFVRHYADSYRYQSATGLDMLAAAEQSCHCHLQPLYDDWITSDTPVAIP